MDKLIYVGDWNFSVRKEFVLNPNISIGAKMVWIALRSYCAPGAGTSWPSSELVANCLNCSRDTFYKYCTELVKLGMLKREQVVKDGRFSHTQYTVIEMSCAKNPCAESSVTENFDTKNNHLSKELPLSITGGVENRNPTGTIALLSAKHAEEIYQAYPRKEGKVMAIKAILKAMEKCSVETLLSQTKAWADAQRGRDMRYCPLPATWFNQMRYNDDAEVWLQSGASSMADRIRKLKEDKAIVEAEAERIMNQFYTKPKDDPERIRLEKVYAKLKGEIVRLTKELEKGE